MKAIGSAAVVAILFSVPVFAQAPAPKPAAAAAAPAMKAEKEPAPAMPARKSRATEDARSCLQHATNREVAQCAEAYR